MHLDDYLQMGYEYQRCSTASASSSDIANKIMYMLAHQQQLPGPHLTEQQTEHHWQTSWTLILPIQPGSSPEMTGVIPLHCAIMGNDLHQILFLPLTLSHTHTSLLMLVRWLVTSSVFSPSLAWMLANWFFSWALSSSLLATPDTCRLCASKCSCIKHATS